MALISGLSIANLKSFRGPFALPLRQITLIYGPNSGGKSSLMQSLLLLAQTVRGNSGQLVLKGGLTDLGSFSSAIHSHNTDLRLTIGVSIVPEGARVSDLLFEAAFRKAKSGGPPEHWTSTLTVGGNRLLFQRREVPANQTSIRASTEPAYFVLESPESARAFTSVVEALATHAGEVINAEILELLRTDAVRPAFAAQGLFPTHVRRMLPSSGSREVNVDVRNAISGWDSFIDPVGTQISEALGGLIYLGPLRQAPERFSTTSGRVAQSVGKTGEHSAEVLAASPQLCDRANLWLERLGIPYQMEVIDLVAPALQATVGEVLSLVLTDIRSNLKVSPSEVGFGVSQLLPIVIEATLAESTVICIEQPEVHIHPRLQAEVAELLVASAKGRGNQFHS